MARGARKSYLSVALIHAPLALAGMAREESNGTALKLCDPETGEPVKQVYLNERTGVTRGRGELGRAVEVSKGEYRMIDGDKLAVIEGAHRLDRMEVIETAPLESLPVTRIIDAHYVQPVAGSTKVLALIYEALGRTGRAAVVRFAVGTRQRLGVLLPQDGALVALTLRYAAAHKAPDEEQVAVSDAAAGLAEAEVATAVELIEALDGGGSAFDAEADSLVEEREDLIARTLAGEEVAPEPVEEPDPMGDLEAVLAASLAAVGGGTATKAKPKKKTKRKGK